MSETDTKACPVNEAQALFLDKPSLHTLSYALRHPDTWPKGFIWNYKSCDQCAMGLAHQLWKDKVTNADKGTGPTIMARAFAMPYDAARSIFLAEETGRQGRHIANWAPKRDFTKGHLWWKTNWVRLDAQSITPEMVADQIDKYLATAE